ncbi:MAG: ATP-binding protein [Bryobacterales bacterium]|nr:ATP-binding protein [Bryobacterales bacterium]
MALLKPWYKVVTPREDLRESKPLDASEFAVHLDHVREGRAPEVYKNPENFFDRTYLTRSLLDLAAQVVRRLSGEKTETSAVFNLATQFGGGKTHALTLLYHLAKNGPKSHAWAGVRRILEKAGVSSVPEAAVAVFVGTEFDSISGRGGDDGTPLRKTPWGEIAWQLGGEAGFAAVAEHDRQFVEPKGDVIQAFLPKDKPCLILMDEVINYTSTYRHKGYHRALYNFIQSLSEQARGSDKVVLLVSIPASEMPYSSDDEADEQWFKKMLDRVGKPIMMAAESETAEIIRRRLFEWHGLNDDAKRTIAEYSDWIVEHRQQIPNWFPVDTAREAFAATYPLHPSVLSVFERKWQTLPRFQRTRGVLRLLAIWVSRAYQEGFQGAHKDPLIGLGTAPLDDPMFRSALFEQLGENKLEGAVTTDICGKKDSHAVRLDAEAVDTIRKARLNRKVAASIFFESNGGQARAEATIPEIRLAVAEPSLDIGNVETVVDALENACYFLSVDRNRYRFGLTANLNKLLADKRASIQQPRIDDRVRTEVQAVFSQGPPIDRIFFPEKSSQIPNRAALTIVVLPPENGDIEEGKRLQLVDSMTKQSGTSDRTFKSALIWCVPDSGRQLCDEARKLLAWEDIQEEAVELKLEDIQRKQLAENLGRSKRDLREAVWRTYKTVMLLAKDNSIRSIDLGLVHSSADTSLVGFIVNRLKQDGDISDGISPKFLARNWSGAHKEWSTKAVKDAVFASPLFPRLLSGELMRDTIARGVSNGVLAYVGKTATGAYDPFVFGVSMSPQEVEISEDVYVITAETAEAYKQSLSAPPKPIGTGSLFDSEDGKPATTETGTSGNSSIQAGGDADPVAVIPPDKATALRWSGEVPAQKWMNFYTKVLSRFATTKSLRLTVSVDVSPEGGVSKQSMEETKTALREMGLKDDLL